MFDITPLLHPSDPWPPTERPEDVRECYRFKYAVALMIRPRRILEFGVRFGYSAAAFLAASPTAEYYGCDADVDRHGGFVGAWREAGKMLKATYPASRVTVVKMDTQQESPAEGDWDLVHVDADHGYEGCLNDLRLAARLGTGWILVDDITHPAVPGVAAAVKDFLAESRYPHLFFPSFRGDCLIRLSPTK